MADLLTGSGSGYGDGSGSGYGYGSGSGYGYGSGSGYGDGYGSGYGDGAGYGDGDGYGYGDGYALPDIAAHIVRVPWPGMLSIGCQEHSIDHWRKRWRDIAKDHGEGVDEEEVLALLSRAEAVTIHDIFPPTA